MVALDHFAWLVAVCKGHKREVKHVWTELIKGEDPISVEAKATFMVVTKALEVGVTIVMLDGDVLNVIHQKLHSPFSLLECISST